MSLTTSAVALRFQPARTAVHVRPTDLRGAGRVPLSNIRLRRVAAAAPKPPTSTAAAPWTWTPPDQEQAGAQDTPLSDKELKRQNLLFKIGGGLFILLMAYLDFRDGHLHNFHLKMEVFVLLLIAPF